MQLVTPKIDHDHSFLQLIPMQSANSTSASLEVTLHCAALLASPAALQPHKPASQHCPPMLAYDHRTSRGCPPHWAISPTVTSAGFHGQIASQPCPSWRQLQTLTTATRPGVATTACLPVSYFVHQASRSACMKTHSSRCFLLGSLHQVDHWFLTASSSDHPGDDYIKGI